MCIIKKYVYIKKNNIRRSDAIYNLITSFQKFYLIRIMELLLIVPKYAQHVTIDIKCIVKPINLKIRNKLWKKIHLLIMLTFVKLANTSYR